MQDGFPLPAGRISKGNMRVLRPQIRTRLPRRRPAPPRAA